MIAKQELDKLAAELDIGQAHVERDYVNGWLLTAIFRRPFLAQHLVLKGGNALRKGYFANTRYSKDLDFAAASAIDRDMLLSELREVCTYVTAQSGVCFLSDRLRVADKRHIATTPHGGVEVLEVFAYFFDFCGKKQSTPVRVFMDITQYDRFYLPTVERPLLHPYSDARDCAGVIRCLGLEEILASKLKCLLQRRHVADLFDYLRWLFFGDAPVDLGQLLWVFLRKTIYERSPGVAFELLTSLPFALLEELWERHIKAPIGCRFPFADGVTKLLSHLRELFTNRSKSHSLSFFPSHLRDPIMSAAKNKHLMRIHYGGYDRLIEPYALKFKATKGGGGGEYFYAWDRSSFSGAGVRAFVANRIVALEETVEEFTPRFEIEVAKAGEMPANPRFQGPRRRRSPTGLGLRRAHQLGRARRGW